MGKKLSIGMATYDDFHGVYLEVQAMLLLQDSHKIE
jgi:hypothetical protein